MRVNRPEIWAKLKNKYQLLGLEENPGFELSPILVGTTDIDRICRQLYVTEDDSYINSTGWKSIFTCPTGKRLILLGYSLKPGSGTWSISSLAIYDPINNYSHWLEYKADGLVLPIIKNGLSIEIPEGWKLRKYVNSVTQPGNSYDSYLYTYEDSYPEPRFP